MVSVVFWMSLLPREPLQTRSQPMSSRGRGSLPPWQNWLFVSGTSNRERKKSWFPKTLGFASSIAVGELFTRTVFRHPGLVLPSVARLSGVGHPDDFRNSMVAVATADRACGSHFGLSEPDGLVYILALARLLFVRSTGL